jgi:hypothetical protein
MLRRNVTAIRTVLAAIFGRAFTLNQTLTADLVWQTFFEEVEKGRNNVKRASFSIISGHDVL